MKSKKCFLLVATKKKVRSENKWIGLDEKSIISVTHIKKSIISVGINN